MNILTNRTIMEGYHYGRENSIQAAGMKEPEDFEIGFSKNDFDTFGLNADEDFGADTFGDENLNFGDNPFEDF